MDGSVANDRHIYVAQTPLVDARPIPMGVATPAPEMPDGMQFGALFGVLHRWSRMIGVVTAVGLICVCLLAWSLPVRYTAKAQIIVETPRGLVLDPRRATQNPNADPATMFTEVTALSSYDVLSGVRARLAGDAEYQNLLADSSGHGRSIVSQGTSLLRSILVSVGLKDPSIEAEPVRQIRTPPTIDDLQKRLLVFQEANSHIIAINFTSVNAEEAAYIANQIATYYVEKGDEQIKSTLDGTLSGINGKLVALKAEADALEKAASVYQAAHGIKDAAKTGLLDQQVAELTRQLSSARTEQAAREVRHTNLLALRGATGGWSELLAPLDARGLIDLHAQVMGVLQSRRDNVVVVPGASGSGPRNDSATRPLRENLRGALDQALAKLASDSSSASAQAEAIQRQLTAVRGVSEDVRLRDLVVSAGAARHRYDRMLQKRDEVVEQRDDLTSMARVSSRAPVPEKPSSPSPLLFLVPGTIAFFVMGCCAALMFDRLDETIRSEKDVRRNLGIGCIGMVPRLAHLEPSGALGRILDAPTAPYTEALRSVMVSLQLLRPCQEAPKVMLITSSVPGEGKSTLAVSLAAYAARAGARVLLLDLDFSEKASGHEPYEQRLRGVMDLLAQDQLPAGTIHAADNVHLDYLPVRRGLAADPLPLFSRDHMATLLEKLRGNYDHVFIDSAPVLAKAEVRLLAAIVDSVLFVVRWGRTPGAEVRAALDLLRGPGYSGADISGRVAAVITQVDLRRHVRGRYRDQGEALAKYAGHYKKA